MKPVIRLAGLCLVCFMVPFIVSGCGALGKNMYLAASADALATMKDLLAQGADPNYVSSKDNGETALHVAARLGYTGVLTELIQAGADVNRKDNHQDTPLHVAAKSGQAACIPILVQAGAKVDAAGSLDETPLHKAGRTGSEACALELLKLNAPIDARNAEGSTPLHNAVSYDKYDLAGLLLKMGADPMITDSGGRTAAQHIDMKRACSEGQAAPVKLYLDLKGDPNQHSSVTAMTPLQTAVQYGHLDIVKLLVEAGADLTVQAKTKWGDTALHYAANYNQPEILECLLEAGADVNARAKDGSTPLFQACGISELIKEEPFKTTGLVEIARILLEHHADPMAADNDDYTPMLAAAKKGVVDVTGVLWSFGVQVDVKNKDNITAREFAAKNNQQAWLNAVDQAQREDSTVNMQMNLAARTFGMGAYDKALIACKQTLEGNAACRWPRVIISSIVSGFAGTCCLTQGMSEEAVTYLEQAVKECAWIPAYADQRNEFVGYLGLAYSRTGANDKAEPLLLESIARLKTADYQLLVQAYRNLAEHYLRLKQPGKAMAEIEKALAVAERESDRRLQAMMLKEESLDFDDAGEYEYVLKTIGKNLELARRYGWADSEAWFLSDLGHVYNKMERAADALKQYEEAITKARAGNFTEVLAASLTGYSSSLMDLGRSEEALAPAREAGELYRKLGDEAGVVEMAGQAAVIAGQLGRYGEALPQFASVMEAARKQGQPQGEAHALGNMGFCHLQLGNYGKAVEMLQQAIDICTREEMVPDEATYRVHMGSALLALGDAPKAMEMYTQARDLFDKAGSKRGRALALNAIAGLLLDKKRTEEALKVYEDVVAIDRELNDPSVLGTSLNNIGRACQDAGQLDKAEAYFRESLELARASGQVNETAAPLNNLAGLLKTQGKPEEALQMYLGILEMVAASGVKNHIVTLQRNIGLLYIQQKKYSDAEKHLQACVDILEELRGSTEGADALNFLSENVSAYEFLTEAQVRQNEFEKAWQTIEMMRARGLADRLQQKGCFAPVPEPTQMASWIDKNTLLLVFANSDQDDLVRLHLARNGQLKGGLQSLAGFEDTLRKEFKALHDEYLDREDTETPIMKMLIGPADRAKIYWGSLYRFLLAHPEPKYSKPRERLARLLYDLYFGGLEKELAGKDELLISPDRVLAEIPVETLITPDGKYLVEKYNVRYIHSLRVYNVLRHRPLGERTQEMMIVAAPDYTTPAMTDEPAMIASVTEARELEKYIEQQAGEGKSLMRAYARLGVTSWPKLEGTRVEAEAIAAVYPEARLMQGKDAIEMDVVTSDLNVYRTIHIAAHGFAMFGFEKLIALVLSPDASTEAGDEGYLTVDEIGRLDIRADLVTLSACSTAVGSFYGGEGIVGLPNALIAAGANSTVVSQWQVADESTAKLMMGAYKLMKEKRIGFDRALTEMKRAFIQGRVSSDKLDITRGVQVKKDADVKGSKYSDPFFWAPFIFYGLPPKEVMTEETVPDDERHLMPGFGC